MAETVLLLLASYSQIVYLNVTFLKLYECKSVHSVVFITHHDKQNNKNTEVLLIGRACWRLMKFGSLTAVVDHRSTHVFLSLKGLEDAAIPVSSGSALLCSWQYWTSCSAAAEIWQKRHKIFTLILIKAVDILTSVLQQTHLIFSLLYNGCTQFLWRYKNVFVLKLKCLTCILYIFIVEQQNKC